MKRFLAPILFALASLTLVAQTAPKAALRPVYVHAGHLFDATSDSVRENVVITILGDRIQSIGPAGSVSIPGGATVIDLSHATVLPGLIDCHTHLGARADRYEEIYRFKDTRSNPPLPAWSMPARLWKPVLLQSVTLGLSHFLPWTCAIPSMKALFQARALLPAARLSRSPVVTAI